MGQAVQFSLLVFVIACMVFSGDASNAKGKIRKLIESKVNSNGNKNFIVPEPGQKPKPILASLSNETAVANISGLITKTFDDPKGCVMECRENFLLSVVNETLGPVLDLVLVVLNASNITTDAHGNISITLDEEELQEAVLGKLGTFFISLCQLSTGEGECLDKCPKSDFREIAKEDLALRDVLCEYKHYHNISEFLHAFECLNSTQADEICEQKCGEVRDFDNITHLEINGQNVTYSTDVKKNTHDIKESCNITSCTIECAKPIVSKECGDKIFDSFVRIAKSDMQYTLNVLNTIGAVEPGTKCDV